MWKTHLHLTVKWQEKMILPTSQQLLSNHSTNHYNMNSCHGNYFSSGTGPGLPFCAADVPDYSATADYA